MNYDAVGSGSNLMTNGDVEHTSSSFGKGWIVDSPLEAIMLTSVILNAMAAGIIFIFSNTIMPALATLDSDVGIKAMVTINDIIVNPPFIIVFFGGLVSAYPAGAMWSHPDAYSTPARYYAAAATLAFFFGEFVVTVTQNVPRNDALLAVDPQSDSGAGYWRDDYLRGWVAWNTAQGIFAAVASVLGAHSLFFMGRSAA